MSQVDKGIRYFKCTNCGNRWDELHSNHESKVGDYCPECNALVIPHRSESIK